MVRPDEYCAVTYNNITMDVTHFISYNSQQALKMTIHILTVVIRFTSERSLEFYSEQTVLSYCVYVVWYNRTPIILLEWRTHSKSNPTALHVQNT